MAISPTTTRSSETVLITGASSGLGLSFARYFAQNGYSIVMVANDKAKLEAAKDTIPRQPGVKITTISQDLSQLHAANELYKKIQKQHIQIHILINNAGFGTSGAFINTDYTKEQDEMMLNMVTLSLLTKLFLKDMVERDKGRILNISSIASMAPGPYMAVYYATKAYVLHLSEALSEELKGTSVTVSVFCPGPTSTNFASVAGVEKSTLFSRKLPTADTAVATAIKGLFKEKRVIFDTTKNHIGATISKFIPRSVLLHFIAKINKK